MDGDLHRAGGEALGRLYRYLRGDVGGRKFTDDAPVQYRTAFHILIEPAASVPIPTSPDLPLPTMRLASKKRASRC